jgi:O-methyltransferase involved in polyketide biosynthesis
VEWYDLDFPEVIDVRKHFFTETTRYHMIGSSVLDYKWMDSIRAKLTQPVFIYAEGVFMYLTEEQVKGLIIQLKDKLPGADLVFENCHRHWVERIQKSKLMRLKFRARFKWDKSVVFRWGVADSKELETWDLDLKFVDENIYLTSDLKRFGWMRFMMHNPLIIKSMWIIHYRFG